MKESKISWTHSTFNLLWGCTKVSEGCEHCYAASLSARYGHDVWGAGKERRTFGAKHWAEPLKWDAEAGREGRRRRVFCSSMCDVFEDHPTVERERAKLWPLIEATPNLDGLLLTKRPERIVRCLPKGWGEGWPNVWLGTTVENRKRASERLPVLKKISAVVRFVSVEPLLESLDGMNWRGIDWVIVGGESGPGHRDMPDEWAEEIRDDCAKSGSVFYFKQHSGAYSGIEPSIKGVPYHHWPEPRKVKEMALLFA